MAARFVSPRQLPSCTAQKYYFSASGTHFCWSLSKRQGLVRPEGLGKLKKKSIHLIGSQTRDLPACSMVPQLTTPERKMHYIDLAVCAVVTVVKKMQVLR
jgi:hypothetical protein